MIQSHEGLEVKESQISGRGVFATKPFIVGQVIEVCPVLVVPTVQVAHIDETGLYDYYFSWENKAAALALGFGSLYNHSYQPNAVYTKLYDQVVVEFCALKDINAGEEVTVNYAGDPEGTAPLWFEAKTE